MAIGTGLPSVGGQAEILRRPGIVQSNDGTAELWGQLARTSLQVFDAGIRQQKQQAARYIADVEVAARRRRLELVEQYRYDPAGFEHAWGEHEVGVLSEAEPSLVPEVRTVLGQEGNAGFAEVTNAKNSRDEGLAKQSHFARLEMAERDLLNVSAGGGTPDDIARAAAAYDNVATAGVGLGFMADDERLRRRQTTLSRAAGERLTMEVKQAYKQGGAGAARKLIEGAFIPGEGTGLTAADARLYQNRADSLIDEMESERRAQLREARAAVREIRMDLKEDARTVTEGMSIGGLPSMEKVENLAQQLERAGAPQDAERLRTRYASARYLNDYAKRPPQAQAQLLAEARTALDKGEVEPWLVKEMEQSLSRTRTAMTQDPIGHAAQIGLVDLPPVDWTGDANAFAESMQARTRAAGKIEEHYGLSRVSPLTRDEIDGLKNAYDRADSEGRAVILGRLAGSLDQDRLTATLEKVANDRPVLAWAGGMARRSPDLAQSIVRGEALMKADRKSVPSDNDAMRATVDSYLGEAMSTMPSARAAAVQAAMARYADLSAAAGDMSGLLDSNRMEQALAEVTGGVTRYRGRKIVLPPGVDEDRFDDLMDGLTDADLAGAVTAKGTAVRAADFRKLGKLVDYGDGKYLIDLGGAGYVRGADGKEFVLDIAKISGQRADGYATNFVDGSPKFPR